MTLVQAMLAQGATIPEVSAVLTAADVLANGTEFTTDELFEAEATLDEAAARWLGITEEDA
jgi:hypothetical protein